MIGIKTLNKIKMALDLLSQNIQGRISIKHIWPSTMPNFYMTIWKYEGLILMQMLYKFKIYELDIYITAGQIYSG